MKRSDLEQKKESLLETVSSTVAESPLKSVVAIFLLGFICGIFKDTTLGIFIIGGAVLAVIWYIAKPDEFGEPEETFDYHDGGNGQPENDGLS